MPNFKRTEDMSGKKKTDLVSISPKVVLGPNVLVRIFDAILEGRLVLPVLPMLIPEVIGVDRCNNQGGRNDTAFDFNSVRIFYSIPHPIGGRVRLTKE